MTDNQSDVTAVWRCLEKGVVTNESGYSGLATESEDTYATDAFVLEMERSLLSESGKPFEADHPCSYHVLHSHAVSGGVRKQQSFKVSAILLISYRVAGWTSQEQQWKQYREQIHLVTTVPVQQGHQHELLSRRLTQGQNISRT